MKRLLVLNSASSALLLAVNLAVAFVLSPVLVRELGNRDFGIWEIVLSVFGYLSVLELGLGPAVVRFTARHAARDDREALERTVNSALVTLALAGLVGLGLMLVIGSLPRLLFTLEPGDEEIARRLAAILGVNLLVVFPGTVFSAYLFGRQRYTMVNGLKIVITVGQAVLMYLALTSWAGSKLLWLAGLLLGFNTTYFLLLAVWVLAVTREVRLRPSAVDAATGRELVAFGARSLVLRLSEMLQRQAMPIVIGAALGAAQVVFFAIPSRLVTYAIQLVQSILGPLMPYFSDLEGREASREATLRAWYTLTRVVQFILVGLGVAITGLGEPFVGRWIGPEYADAGRWVVRGLGAMLFVEAMSPVAVQFTVGRGRHGRPARWTFLLALAGLAAAFALAEAFGLEGVVMAVILVRSCTLTVWARSAAALLEVPLLEHVRRTLLPFALPAALALAALAGLRSWFFPETWPLILGYGTVAAALYALTALTLAVRGEERARMLEVLGRLAGRAGAGRTG